MGLLRLTRGTQPGLDLERKVYRSAACPPHTQVSPSVLAVEERLTSTLSPPSVPRNPVPSVTNPSAAALFSAFAPSSCSPRSYR